MTKYVLIEFKHGPDSEKLGPYDSFEKAAGAMRDRMHDLCTYRIEEVEESIMDRVKTVDDAVAVLRAKSCMDYAWKLLGNWEDLNRMANPPKHLIVILFLEIITAALNEGWKPDWEDGTQEKWEVRCRPTTDQTLGAVNICVSNTSPRLYFKSRELAEYAAKQFRELYVQLLAEKL